MIYNYLKKLLRTSNVRKSKNYMAMAHSDDYTYISSNKASAYSKNVIVYRCVNLIAQSASHVPWVVTHNRQRYDKTNPDHCIYRLLSKPNPEKAGADFFSEIIASKLLFGNAYILSTAPDDSIPHELYLLNSSATEIVCKQNIAIAYKYNTAHKAISYPIDPITKLSKVLHLKNYHPTDRYYGLSCLEAASMQIELHLYATNWNRSLLKNGARPSGALIMKDGNSYLTDDQFERLQQELLDKFSNSNNAGRPMLLEGGLDWKEMSINPKDMDFIESKNSAAREIALAFGVPPQLLGISGDNTYSNMQEARLALWEETLIPLLDKIADALSQWLSNSCKQDIHIDFDRDNISALTEKRENLWSKIANANFMTLNEKRAFIGMGPIENGDKL